MIIDIISIFPNLIESYANESILKRAQDANLATINAVNLRDYSSDKFRHVDDTPYGGGAGMVFKCEPCFLAIEDCLSKNKSHKKTRVIYTSPCGKPFNQEYAEELSFEDHIIILCGRYEGVDQRIIDTYVTDEISIGDYVITGGELASLVISDAVLRLIPDVLGNNASCMFFAYLILSVISKFLCSMTDFCSMTSLLINSTFSFSSLNSFVRSVT